LIDCDVHHVIGDREQFLDYVEPGQRAWFASQPTFGLPGYTWTHPVSWWQRPGEASDGDGALPEGSTLSQIRAGLDAYGTDIAILNGNDVPCLALMPSAYRAEALARAHNDWVRECWLDEEPRLRGSIVCPAQDPLRAAAEIRRVAQDERFVQVLLPGGSERPYGDPRYLPIFEAAAEHGLRVAIHANGEGIGIAAPGGGAGYHTFYIEWHTLGSAGSTMAHMVSLVCNGVFGRFPGLMVALLEGGVAWLPGILWRLDMNWRGMRAEVPWLTEPPSAVVRRHLRFGTQPLEHTPGHDALLFEMLGAVGGEDILVYASDFPHWDLDDPSATISRLPPAWRDKVLHENALALYAPRLGVTVR
jgi:predicted TIM-barrel fold metal-dependent hydrolase